MIINDVLLNKLSFQSKSSSRLRINFDLRNTSDDSSQRMLNAMEVGTVMPIHRHQKTSETMIILRGSLKEYFYDEQGNITEEIMLKAGGPNFGLNIPAGQWHSLEVLEPDTVIFEAKDGKYEPLSDEDVIK